MRKRSKGITIRVDEKEKKKLERLAKMCGLSLSEYLRKVGVGHQPKEIPSDNFYKMAQRLEGLSVLQEEELRRSISECLEELYAKYIYGREEKQVGSNQVVDDKRQLEPSGSVR